MVLRVRDLLRAALPNPSPWRIPPTACISRRAAHRRLEDEGIELSRHQGRPAPRHGPARLAKTGDSIAQIAGDLGFADTSAFYRAFVDWTGVAPAHSSAAPGANIQ